MGIWAVLLLLALGLPWFGGSHTAPVFDHLLPLSEPSQRGATLARAAFPNLYAQAQAAIVIARQPGPLTPSDLALERETVTDLQSSPDARTIPAYRVKCHFTDPLLTKRLLALDAANQPRAAVQCQASLGAGV